MGNVILSKSAAVTLGKRERRRRRKTVQTFEYMVKSLFFYLKLYNIWGIFLILHIRKGHYVPYLFRNLKAKKNTYS